MTKQQTLDLLAGEGIGFEEYTHPAVFTAEEAIGLNLPHPESGARNLFMRDQKKKNYYLLTLRDDFPVRIKDFELKVGAKHLSFASEDDLMSIMGLIRGSVTPLGVLSDEDRIVRVYIDSYFSGKGISVHPNDNTATVFLSSDDLIGLIRKHGNEVSYIEL